MFDEDTIRQLRKREYQWRRTTLQETLEEHPERREEFVTTSSAPVECLYGPTDVADLDYDEDLGFPGEYPFTRGVHATMHRGRLWTMRQFSGFGTAEQTNQRFKYLLKEGETGLSVAFDNPTLYGYDTDDPLALGEFGQGGVAVSSLADMEVLFEDIPLDQVTTSMTINGPAAIIWAMYIAVAEKQGVAPEKLGGTIQNDILKEYIAQKEWLFPPEAGMKLVVDTIEYGSKHLPKWNTISISGYHIREAGSTAAQELAFTLADGMEYVRWCLDRGLDVDDFAPRLSFFFNCHNDFFEEVAKFRAARRIWAREMKDTFRAENPRSWWMRFHTQTAGCSLTAQQPENNVVRVAIQALAAVLGGTQSLHTNSLDEALALPSEWAARIALRTQQIIAHESGVTNTVDPLGGSFFVETMTDRIEEQVYEYFEKIEELGGVVPAVKGGFFQREIADAAAKYQAEIDSGERIIVGVNEYTSAEKEEVEVPLFQVDPEGEEQHLARLERVRAERDQAEVDRVLYALRNAAEVDENLMPYILDAVRAYATLGETANALREVYGEYREPVIV